jgi:hypothetical protein
MAKVLAQYTDYFALTIQHMQEEGLLLVTTGADGKPNVMTIRLWLGNDWLDLGSSNLRCASQAVTPQPQSNGAG